MPKHPMTNEIRSSKPEIQLPGFLGSLEGPFAPLRNEPSFVHRTANYGGQAQCPGGQQAAVSPATSRRAGAGKRQPRQTNGGQVSAVSYDGTAIRVIGVIRGPQCLCAVLQNEPKESQVLGW